MKHSSNNYEEDGDPNNGAVDGITDEADPSRFDDDPDGVPLFDTNESRATLFGLEPRENVDPLDSGLQFTGPVILFLSVYVTLSLFFGDDMPPLDVLNL